MRTTVTPDDDVIEAEQARTGGAFRGAINRLLRRDARAPAQDEPPEPPLLPGRPLLALDDVSAVLATVGERSARMCG